MTTKHTPGPWEYRVTKRLYIVEMHKHKDSLYGLHRIAEIPRTFLSESEANAQLIADAPELLDVCRELLGPMIVWSQYWASTYNRGVMSPAHEEIIQRASVVIARNTPNEDNE